MHLSPSDEQPHPMANLQVYQAWTARPVVFRGYTDIAVFQKLKIFILHTSHILRKYASVASYDELIFGLAYS